MRGEKNKAQGERLLFFFNAFLIQGVCGDNPFFTCVTTAEHQTMHDLIHGAGKHHMLCNKSHTYTNISPEPLRYEFEFHIYLQSGIKRWTTVFYNPA